MRQVCYLLYGLMLWGTTLLPAQEREVLIPSPISGSPFQFQDQQDRYGQAYRWFLEGDIDRGSDMLREIVSEAGYQLLPENYYVVVAHFTDAFAPIGMFHGDQRFLNTRLYGLEPDNLFFIYLSRSETTQAYVSVLATSKPSPSEENLLAFLSLFIPIIPPVQAQGIDTSQVITWVDVRQFEVPPAFRKNSDLAFLVKKRLDDENPLAAAVFDNTSRERWSYGIATAITSVNDVDITISNDGRIIVKPKPNLDLATFAVIDYHFKAIDTKAPTFGNSLHLMGGIRLANFIEPIVGLGASFSLDFIDLAIFAGYSLEFANELKEGFHIGQQLDEGENPFKLNLRGKPRFGLQIKFP